MIPVFIKGHNKIPGNYKGITLLNMTLVVMTKVLELKLLQHINFEEEQHGFRNGRSCNDALLVIQQIKENATEFRKPAFMLSLIHI